MAQLRKSVAATLGRTIGRVEQSGERRKEARGVSVDAPACIFPEVAIAVYSKVSKLCSVEPAEYNSYLRGFYTKHASLQMKIDSQADIAAVLALQNVI